MKVLMNVMKKEMDEIIIMLLYPLEFPRSQWLLLLEWGPFRCGDFVEIRRSRHTIDDSRHWRRILSGNGQIGMGTQSSTSTIGLRHRSCRYVVNIFIYLSFDLIVFIHGRSFWLSSHTFYSSPKNDVNFNCDGTFANVSHLKWQFHCFIKRKVAVFLNSFFYCFSS
jgi:hypothetical protein